MGEHFKIVLKIPHLHAYNIGVVGVTSRNVIKRCGWYRKW